MAELTDEVLATFEIIQEADPNELLTNEYFAAVELDKVQPGGDGYVAARDLLSEHRMVRRLNHELNGGGMITITEEGK